MRTTQPQVNNKQLKFYLICVFLIPLDPKRKALQRHTKKGTSTVQGMVVDYPVMTKIIISTDVYITIWARILMCVYGENNQGPLFFFARPFSHHTRS